MVCTRLARKNRKNEWTNTLAYLAILIKNSFVIMTLGANVLKLFTEVIYCHSIALLSFCAIKQYYYSNYHRKAPHYNGKKFYKTGPRWYT
jgi:hypothetical protein